MFPNTSGKDFNNAYKMSRNLFYIMIKGNQISGAIDTHNDEVTGIFCCKLKKKIKFFKSILKAKVSGQSPKQNDKGWQIREMVLGIVRMLLSITYMKTFLSF